MRRPPGLSPIPDRTAPVLGTPSNQRRPTLSLPWRSAWSAQLRWLAATNTWAVRGLTRQLGLNLSWLDAGGARIAGGPAPGSPSGVAVDVVCVEFGLLGVDAGYRYDFGVWMKRGI
jgi:hypothetical protein